MSGILAGSLNMDKAVMILNYSKMLAMIEQALNKNTEVKMDFCLTSQTAKRIELWSRMLQDRPPWRSKTIRSAGLPAAIAAETARLVTLELKSDITGSPRANYLQTAYKNILSQLRIYVELGCAKGGLIIKPYVANGKINIQFVQADAFFPISFDGSGRITQCVFLEMYRSGDKRYYRLEIHGFDTAGRIRITNRAFVSTNDYSLGSEIDVASVPRWVGMDAETVFEGASRLPFGYFRVPLANTEDNDSPLGVSVYSRAVDLIRVADKRYSQLDWEYDAKEAAVHIANSLLKFNTDTQKYEYPAGKERLYREFEYNVGAQDKPLLDAYSPNIRDQSYLAGFNNQLRRIEFACNLAYGTLSDPSDVDKTAEEIRASKQRSYSFVSDCQMALQRALQDAVAAMDFYCTVHQLAPKGDYEIGFVWDDSIVVDTDKERQSDRQDVAMGAMPLWEYRAKWYGEDEKTARAVVNEEPPEE